MKRVLSIDGGGIRGIIPAVVCSYIERISQKSISDLFDLVAGTSTGGILALGFGRPPNGITATELAELYARDGRHIFSNPRGFVRRVYGPKFDGSGLSRTLANYLGSHKISESRVELVIPAYDIKYRTPVIFTRRNARSNSSDDSSMYQVAMGTTAAPTYFPPFEMNDRALIDGGLVANNPALLALKEAHALWPNEPVLLVSIGTGTLAQSIDGHRAQNFGDIDWAERAINCMFDGTAKATEDFLSHTLQQDRYWRFQYGLSELTENLDNASDEAIVGLKQVADHIIRDQENRLDRLIKILLQQVPEPEEVRKARDVLERTHLAFGRSLEVKNRIFTLGVQNKLNELLKDATDWAAGTIRVPADDKGRFLVDLYREANASVFSTRLKQFSGTFKRSSLTREILEAHKQSKAATTRVFVFDDERDVSGFDYQEMARESAAGIEVLILIRKNKTLSIEDFTIIDNSAVGVTEFVGLRDAAARWTFDRHSQITVYQSIRDQLISESVSLKHFLEGRLARFALWTHHELKDVSEENIENYQRISKKYFGEEAADDARVLDIQRHAGGIYLLERRSGSKVRAVGIFSLIPVSIMGYRALEDGDLRGAQFDPKHLATKNNERVLAYYLGAIAGIDRKSSAVLTDFLRTSAAEFGRDGVESIFARPVTDDGLRLLTNERLRWHGPSGGPPEMNRMCRLRLT